MGGKAVSSVHIVSNPIVTIARLLYTHSKIMDPSEVRPQGVARKTVEFLIEQALARTEDSRFIGAMEKYKLYMEGESQNTSLMSGGVLDNLHLMRGRQIMFLGFENKVLENLYGRLGTACIDDFDTQTEFAKYLLRDIYLRAQPHVREGMREMVWYRMGVYDFPFMIGDDILDGGRRARINNPFGGIAELVDDLLAENNKVGLGDQVRHLDDTSRQTNYMVSDTAFSGVRFSKRCKSMPGYLENLHHAYVRKHGETSIGDFEKLCKAAIRINKEILRIKYARILDILDISDVTCYMLQGDFSKELLEKAAQTVRVPGIKLLQDTSDMPRRGVLETQALNRLSGWLTARYHTSGKRVRPIIVPRRKRKELPEYQHSILMPGIKTLGTSKQIDDGLKRMDQDVLEMLKGEIRTKRFSLSSIEVVLVRINNENFVVETDAGKTQWQDILDGRTVQPFPLQDVRKRVASFSGAYTRPSISGTKCELHKYIGLFPNSHWEGMGDSDASLVGNALHTIANELLTRQHTELPNYGIRAVERSMYCEVPIVHEYKPTDEEWARAEAEVMEMLNRTNLDFYAEMWNTLRSHREEGAVILDGGKPDGVGIIEQGMHPVIFDFKRRVASREMVKYFAVQTSRYALAVMQNKGIETDRFYTAIIQTPYTPAPHLDIAVEVDGPLRDQVIRLREVRTDGAFIAEVKQDMILEHVGNITLHEEPSLGFELVRHYMKNSRHKRPSCHQCFANNPRSGSYQCRFLLEGKKELWPGTEAEE